LSAISPEWIPQGVGDSFIDSFIIQGPDWLICLSWSLGCPFDTPRCVYEELPTLMPFADALLAEIAAARP